MYELIILSLLMRQPAHGYMVARIINDIIGPIAKASNGRIYPLLAKLEEQGLLTAAEEEQDGRSVRVFRITDAGRRRFHTLMMDTTSNPREYMELFSFKVSVFDLLTAEERLYLIDHYMHYCRAHMLHLERGVAEIHRTAAGDPGVESLLGVMQHRIRQWQLELTWAASLRAREGAGNHM
jgi:DNA-binding PadR family transcriptional regulator